MGCIFLPHEQRSPEWDAARAGRFSGSRFGELMAKPREPGSGARVTLIKDLAWERFCGKKNPNYASKAMDRGTDLEAEAIRWYAFVTDTEPKSVGFGVWDKLEYVGVSLDAVVGSGQLEVKCPEHRAYMEIVRKRQIPSAYHWQIQGQLMVSEAEWSDFLAFHPDHGGIIIRAYPNKDDFASLEAACIEANNEVVLWLNQLERDAA